MLTKNVKSYYFLSVVIIENRMNASNASSVLSSGPAVVAGANRWNWTVSLAEIIYFGSGFILGSILTLAMLFVRSQCKHSNKKKEEKEEEDDDDNENSTGQML